MRTDDDSVLGPAAETGALAEMTEAWREVVLREAGQDYCSPAPAPLTRSVQPPEPRVPPDPRAIDALAERRAYVERLWQLMYTRTEILGEVGRYFVATRATVENDLRVIRQRYLREDKDPEVTSVRKARLRVALEDLYRRTLAAGEHKPAMQVLDRIAKLDGLYAPLKLEVTNNVNLSLTVEVIVAALDEKGLAAFELVVAQLERAGVRGLIPSGDEEPRNVIDVDDVSSAST